MNINNVCMIKNISIKILKIPFYNFNSNLNFQENLFLQRYLKLIFIFSYQKIYITFQITNNNNHYNVINIKEYNQDFIYSIY